MAFAYLVAIAELVGGFMLLIGLWTWLAASILAIEMAYAVLFIHLGEGWPAVRLPLLLFAILIRYIGTEGFGSLVKR
jgi:uncharacterized membrane protein YphA (DoxX/SURF4 family)